MTDHTITYKHAMAGWLGVFLAWLAAPIHAQTLSLPDYKAPPGGTVRVPLGLDDASGLASFGVQVNFDASVATVELVTQGPLGSQFEMSHSIDDGRLRIFFARPDALSSGSGRLAVIQFMMNPGAQEGIFSDLAIARFDAADQDAVAAQWDRALGMRNGRLTATLSAIFDNDGDGMPDLWEAGHGLDSITDDSGEDPEGDGLRNLAEFAFCLNPRLSDAARGPAPAVGQFDAGLGHADQFLALSFRRPRPTSLTYAVDCGFEPGQWTGAGVLVNSPTDNGDGTETVTFRDTVPISGAKSRFMRVRVESAP